ncbi:hypothetical protein D477_021323 [Arthrobacter crystallopoietes BAB-32]|uniref:IraD/Gp25-like domain-containing protein n=1 Tax=Arthrobacter crystallopoietes BAB-32 TaxID=1246476 RepID=N1UP64_9MICC|nr:GPW/gp25 family protein [Arthrobacter crystallopoietes]EMY32211.1 hypothetical protein D477_021323 [Arthrobacter crystallopoietes BAB-32]
MSMPRYRALAMVHPDFDADAGPAGLRTAPGGGLASVTDAAAVRQSLLLLLSTRPGERVNRPDYGCRLFQLVFEPAGDTTAGLAVHYVARAIERWEERISILSLDAGRMPEEPGQLEIRLHYRIRATSHEDRITVVVPVRDAGIPPRLNDTGAPVPGAYGGAG